MIFIWYVSLGHSVTSSSERCDVSVYDSGWQGSIGRLEVQRRSDAFLVFGMIHCCHVVLVFCCVWWGHAGRKVGTRRRKMAALRSTGDYQGGEDQNGTMTEIFDENK